MFRLQITALDTLIWRAADALDTSILAEAVQIADRLAAACRRAAPPSRGAIQTWVVAIVGETESVVYRAPVLTP